MPIYRLDERLVFPSPDRAHESGLLAVGGDLRPERLLLAYSSGIFPWYERKPILWHSPDPRTVLSASRLHVPRSLRKTMRKAIYEIRLDTSFGAVVDGCAQARELGGGTWITSDMKSAYAELFRMGFVHTAEAWREGELVGGLYGVSLGAAYFGESMFSRADDASKVAFVTLVEQLRRWGMELVDCQVHTEHLERFGAEEWPRARYLEALRNALTAPTRIGRWSLDPDLQGVTT